MSERHRALLILHGGIMIALALVAGFLTVADEVSGGHGWLATHLSLLMIGIWLIATAAAGPVLVLAEREARGLVWSLAGAAYAFAAVRIIKTLTGVDGFSPEMPPANMVAMLLNSMVALGAFLAALLLIEGARGALRAKR